MVGLACLFAASAVAAPRVSPAEKVAQQADELARQALEEFRKGSFPTAVELYRKAYELDPEPAYLYGQARAQHEAGQYDAAIANYELALSTLNSDDPLRAKCLEHLTRARSSRQPSDGPKGASPERTSAPLPTVVADGASPWLLWSGWTAVAVATAGAAGALAVYLPARQDQAALDERMHQVSPVDGKISGVGLAEARSQQQSINDRIHVTWALAGVAVCSASVGAWLLWQRDDVVVQVVPGPSPMGLSLVTRWR
jgi:tetratricopeptide (TPR) repeat protein